VHKKNIKDTKGGVHNQDNLQDLPSYAFLRGRPLWVHLG